MSAVLFPKQFPSQMIHEKSSLWLQTGRDHLTVNTDAKEEGVPREVEEI